ncbi:unnamed protein product [Lactuca virosa]|uniref:Auxin-responsive protein n=1 Tax=Lactuca virosa TaxID=75947 RepID=A0AAU9MQK0_9ASTR|nr:unnamed protein product [Lactuca virosa]
MSGSVRLKRETTKSQTATSGLSCRVWFCPVAALVRWRRCSGDDGWPREKERKKEINLVAPIDLNWCILARSLRLNNHLNYLYLLPNEKQNVNTFCLRKKERKKMMKVGVMVELFEEYQMVMDMLRERMRSILNQTTTRTATPYSVFYSHPDSSSFIVFF